MFQEDLGGSFLSLGELLEKLNCSDAFGGFQEEFLSTKNVISDFGNVQNSLASVLITNEVLTLGQKIFVNAKRSESDDTLFEWGDSNVFHEPSITEGGDCLVIERTSFDGISFAAEDQNWLQDIFDFYRDEWGKDRYIVRLKDEFTM